MAKEKTTEERVKTLIADSFMIDETEVTPKSNLREDLGGDSLDRVELVMDIEEHFGIAITDAEAEKCKTVADLVALVEKKTVQ